MKASEAKDITNLIKSQIETRILNEESTFLESIYTKIKVAAGKGKTHIYFSVEEEYINKFNLSYVDMSSSIIKFQIDRILTKLEDNGYKADYDGFYHISIEWE